MAACASVWLPYFTKAQPKGREGTRERLDSAAAGASAAQPAAPTFHGCRQPTERSPGFPKAHLCWLRQALGGWCTPRSGQRAQRGAGHHPHSVASPAYPQRASCLLKTKPSPSESRNLPAIPHPHPWFASGAWKGKSRVTPEPGQRAMLICQQIHRVYHLHPTKCSGWENLSCRENAEG